MISDAMSLLISDLEGNGVPVDDFRALEFFAREGDWHTKDYVDHVAELHAWEILPQFGNALRHNLPKAEIQIGDSFKLARLPKFKGLFNFVVLDNPQGLFGENHEYCEHFEALPVAVDLVVPNQSSFIVFNVNSKPFNYSLQRDWRLRREQFYGTRSTELMELDWLQAFYEKKLSRLGFQVETTKIFHRDPQFLHYFVVQGMITTSF